MADSESLKLNTLSNSSLKYNQMTKHFTEESGRGGIGDFQSLTGYVLQIDTGLKTFSRTPER